MGTRRALFLAGAATAAIAMAVPAAARAEAKLKENGTALEVNAEFIAKSTNLKTTTAGGTLECGLVTLYLRVNRNGVSHVVVDQLGEATTVNCQLITPTLELPVTITGWTMGLGLGEGLQLTVNTWGTGQTVITFSAHIYDQTHTTLLTSCHFSGTAHVQGASAGGDVLNVSPSMLSGSGSSCAQEGTIEGSFTLETLTGGVVTLHFSQTG